MKTPLNIDEDILKESCTFNGSKRKDFTCQNGIKSIDCTWKCEEISFTWRYWKKRIQSTRKKI